MSLNTCWNCHQSWDDDNPNCPYCGEDDTPPPFIEVEYHPGNDRPTGHWRAVTINDRLRDNCTRVAVLTGETPLQAYQRVVVIDPDGYTQWRRG